MNTRLTTPLVRACAVVTLVSGAGVLGAPAMATSDDHGTRAGADTATSGTNVGGVRRCAGGPTNYVGVTIGYSGLEWTVTAHDLIDDGPGWTYYKDGGYNDITVWTPYYYASWKFMSVTEARDIGDTCSF